MSELRSSWLDDHHVVRRGISDLLNADDLLTVVGQASTVAQSLTRIPTHRPDVAVLDVWLPDGSGIELCRELRSRLPELHCPDVHLVSARGTGDMDAPTSPSVSG